MAAPRTIYIAGAGIAGLTLALGLAKFGLRVVVLERNDRISTFGAGLQVSPNARKPLDRLGLADAITAKSFEPEAIEIYSDARPSPLQRLELGPAFAERFGAPYAVMHRADLVETLYAAAKRFANIDIVFGVSDIEFSHDRNRLRIVAREPDGKTRRAEPFAFVGADGVRSATRTGQLAGQEARYTGKIAWRALVEPSTLDSVVNLNATSLLLGSRYHLVIYPLPHRKTVNLALFTQHRASDLGRLEHKAPSINAKGDQRLETILDAVGEGWTPWVLSTVEPPVWSKGAIGLIGDAAHAMVPFQAQGAAMAIEDAATLAPLLAASPSPEHAFARFVALRQARVEKVQAVSRANGRIFHMRWPLSVTRNAVIKFSGARDHFRRLAWLYDGDAELSREDYYVHQG